MVINKIVNNDKIFYGYVYHGIYLLYLFLGVFLLVSMFFMFEKGPIFSVVNVVVLLLTNLISYFFKEALKILLKDVISVFNLTFLVLSFLSLTYIEIFHDIYYLVICFIVFWTLDFYFLYKINFKKIKINIKKSSSEKGFDYMLKEDLRRNTYIDFSITYKVTIILIVFSFVFIIMGKFLISSISNSFFKEGDLSILNIGMFVTLIPIFMALVSFFNMLLLYFIEFNSLLKYKNK